MKPGKHGVLWSLTAAVMALALLMACDSGSSGGGGTNGNTDGYTLADLAGTWVLSVTRGSAVETHVVTFDANGTVTKYTSTGCGGNGGVTLKPSTFTLLSDGALRLSSTRFNCNSIGLDAYWILNYKLKLTSATTLTGALVCIRFCDILGSPTCMDVSESWATSGAKQ